MEIPRYTDGGETWYDARLVASGSKLRKFRVQTSTLDSLLANIERPVKFIKVDVEYHELPCIRGAMQIQEWKPILLIEFLRNPDCKGTEQYELLKLLREEGYTPCIFEQGRFIQRALGQMRQNLWFLPPSKICNIPRSIVSAGT